MRRRTPPPPPSTPTPHTLRRALIAGRRCSPPACPWPPQYGLSASAPEELDADEQALLEESYAADPAWSGRDGGVGCAKPAPLRAGRLVIELNDEECPKCALFDVGAGVWE